MIWVCVCVCVCESWWFECECVHVGRDRVMHTVVVFPSTAERGGGGSDSIKLFKSGTELSTKDHLCERCPHASFHSYWHTGPKERGSRRNTSSPSTPPRLPDRGAFSSCPVDLTRSSKSSSYSFRWGAAHTTCITCDIETQVSQFVSTLKDRELKSIVAFALY